MKHNIPWEKRFFKEQTEELISKFIDANEEGMIFFRAMA